LKTVDIWKCECGNQNQSKIITALDGEVVCGRCGTVLGQVAPQKSNAEEQVDSWDGELDLCRKLLEDHVSKKGWES